MADYATSRPPPARRRQNLAVGYARLTGLLGVTFAGLLAVGMVLVNRIPKLGDPTPCTRPSTAAAAGHADHPRAVHRAVRRDRLPLAHDATPPCWPVRRPLSPSAIPDGLHLAASVIFVGLLFAGTAGGGAVALLTDLGAARCPVRTSPGRCPARVRAGVRLRSPRGRHVHVHDHRADQRPGSCPARSCCSATWWRPSCC